ncbi:MAG TPA: hypothetical protein PKM73_14420 [Verrucomicrobiota bacterium]|nr:hypothetical protein [Verrucomicrobiota bacterium]
MLTGLTVYDEVHVSVTFTWDIDRAVRLARAWSHVVPKVRLGGPAMGDPGGEFVPGRYLREGYVITSRGCPGRCECCFVPQREGALRELPIRDGWLVQDNNLLACSEPHVRAVFAMLKRQPRRAQFTGGLEAARLRPWHVDLLADLRPEQMFFALDRLSHVEPLRAAGTMLQAAGFGMRQMRCYVLCGGPGDTMSEAESRMRLAASCGFLPFAMLFRGADGSTPCAEWRRFQKVWSRPAITKSVLAREVVA